VTLSVGTTKVKVVSVTPVTRAGFPATETSLAPGEDASNPRPVRVRLSPGRAVLVLMLNTCVAVLTSSIE
jgi:hypothetical protein